MTLLLLGANGQVGRELRRALAPLGEVVCTTRSGTLEDGAVCEVADFDRPESLPALLDRLAPTVVVNAAAYTAVDKAEEDRDAAFRANAESPGALARWCAAHGVPLVHYSTDYVFDGRGTAPYAVDAPTAPLGVYGASKLAGEEAVRAAGGQHLIIRTAWVYASHGKNFLLTMLRVGAQRDELRVVADQIGTPTSAALIADVTAQVLRQGTEASGTWHLTAAGQTSWHGFAEAIFARAVASGLLPRAPQVVAIPTSEYPTPARRPAYSCLDTTSLQRDFGIDLPPWETALDSVVAELT
ncbi:dTDP-4-dehydrorhamnose reductase [Pseudoxanthomonas winnipegensis]|uniref:dTDP-4-dehydrorhamnose reductase n=1 Tax=Pseudoxanthomonas winnipegensis TaxID=2480810 RepID=A0ABY1WIQ4_9GAMM|nr:dTDP-4-dehydrorhamnose reductase [Pseudoxanthomonas winnipegensis]TAA10006.1 dTDP-4-dehydrorhamnose reductase [Pseudoxanthomonas winnipegensis]TAA22615.1 dTDP-4-dehydrorhamnose reductase [Pseudoxanthomonas winnipegensis]TAH73027.1 dTDP-4-dehydrorhamnose reductase [Pseudoxanthomonas winnipegensis]